METYKQSQEISKFYSVIQQELGNICIEKVIEHLTTHKYFLGEKIGRSPTLEETVDSYINEIFIPVCKLIKSWEFDIAFKKEQKEYLYFSFLQHLYYKREKQPSLKVETVAHDFCLNFGDNKRGKLLVNLLLKCWAC